MSKNEFSYHWMKIVFLTPDPQRMKIFFVKISILLLNRNFLSCLKCFFILKIHRRSDRTKMRITVNKCLVHNLSKVLAHQLSLKLAENSHSWSQSKNNVECLIPRIFKLFDQDQLTTWLRHESKRCSKKIGKKACVIIIERGSGWNE